MESHQASSSAGAMPSSFPYGVPGYGTTALSTYSTTTTATPHTTLFAAPAPSTGVPIHLLQFSPSPSPLPTFSLPTPVFPSPTTEPPPQAPTVGMPAPAFGPSPGLGIPYFSKLDFTSYDGTEDPPLNWLTHCEQFFRGQRTLALDRA